MLISSTAKRANEIVQYYSIALYTRRGSFGGAFHYANEFETPPIALRSHFTKGVFL